MTWALERIVRISSEPYSIITFTHTMAISCFDWMVGGIDDEEVLAPRIKNTSLTCLSYKDGVWRVVF